MIGTSACPIKKSRGTIERLGRHPDVEKIKWSTMEKPFIYPLNTLKKKKKKKKKQNRHKPIQQSNCIHARRKPGQDGRQAPDLNLPVGHF